MKQPSMRNNLWFTVPIAILLAISAGSGVLVNGLYRDVPNLVAQAIGQDFISLLVVLPILILTAGRLEHWIAAMLLIYAILGVISILGYALRSPIVMVGFIAWGPVLGVTVVLLGIWFWRSCYHTKQTNAQQIQTSPLQPIG